MDIDGLVRQVRELGIAARSAREGWEDAWASEGDESWPNPPDDDRVVLVFLNGHVAISDMEGRCDGGWGHHFGFYDHGRSRWRVSGMWNDFVTHWRDLPPQPEREHNAAD